MKSIRQTSDLWQEQKEGLEERKSSIESFDYN